METMNLYNSTIFIYSLHSFSTSWMVHKLLWALPKIFLVGQQAMHTLLLHFMVSGITAVSQTILHKLKKTQVSCGGFSRPNRLSICKYSTLVKYCFHIVLKSAMDCCFCYNFSYIKLHFCMLLFSVHMENRVALLQKHWLAPVECISQSSMRFCVLQACKLSCAASTKSFKIDHWCNFWLTFIW